MLFSRGLRWVGMAMILALVSWISPAAQAQGPGVQRVVILPFAVNAQSDVSFLVKGVRDMLASRLAWQDRVVVMEPDLVAPVAAKHKPPLTDERARQLGKELSAQVVVFGSMTVLGKAVSVDARVVKVGDAGEPLTAFVQAADMDGVIPGINNFAQRINADIFQRPDAVAAQKKAQGEAVRVVTQDKPVDTASDDPASKLPETMSPLNPLFMRTLTGVDSDRYWRSPRIEGAITSIAVGDIDGDGKNELVVLLPNALRIYRLAGDHFALLREFKNGPGGTYLFVDVADIVGNGRPQIYVSNRYNKTLNSFVMQWSEDKGLTLMAQGLPYYFRVQKNPVGQGDILLAQKTVVDEAFFGPVYQMKWKGGELVSEREIPMPPNGGNVYSTLQADLNGSGKPMTVMVALNYALKVFNNSGDESWISPESYAASGKYFELQPTVGSGIEPVWYYLPTRLVLADLDGDGRHEVVVVRNADRADGALEKMRMFYQGTIFGLYWNGMSLVEQWRTPNISGYLADLTIADVGNVGKPALVMAVGQRHMKGFFEADSSHVVAFTLKPLKAPKVGGGL